MPMLQLHHQWATRPRDERYETLEDLERAVDQRRQVAREATVVAPRLRVEADGNDLFLTGDRGRTHFTHWAFSQFCQRFGGDGDYLRTLPAPYAAALANYHLQFTAPGQRRPADASAPANLTKLLFVPPQSGDHAPVDGEVRSATSATYGRIWDIEVVRAVQQINADGRWKVPYATYQHADPLRATTLYASDHDVYLFLCDPDHAIDAGGGDLMYRMFAVRNSEVGDDRSLRGFFGYYRRICDNRMIWGAEGVKEFAVRHDQGGPGRFATDAVPALRAFADASDAPMVATIRTAKTMLLGDSAAAVGEFLKGEGFTQAIIAGAMLAIGAPDAEAAGVSEDASPFSLWNVVQGLTGAVRELPYTQDRVAVERRAGRLLERAQERALPRLVSAAA